MNIVGPHTDTSRRSEPEPRKPPAWNRRAAPLAAAVIVSVGLGGAGAAKAFSVYVSNEKDNTISMIDSGSLNVVKTLKVGQRPRGILLTQDSGQLLVCASDDDTVQVFDAKSWELVQELPSGPDPELFVLHPSGNPLYIANEDDNLVTVVDIENNKVLAEVPVGVAPEGPGISPNGGVLVNASETTNGVSNDGSAIDVARLKVVTSIAVGRFP